MTTSSKYSVRAALSLPETLKPQRGFLIRLAVWAAILSIILTGLTIFLSNNFVTYTETQTFLDIQKEGVKGNLILIIMTLLYWVFGVCFETAIYKNLFFDIDKGRVPLRLGRAEWRVFFTQVLIVLFCSAIIIVGTLLFSILTPPFGFSFEIFFANHIVFWICLASIIILLMFFVFIRLYPAVALSVKYDRFYLFQTWPLTRLIRRHMFLSMFILMFFLRVIEKTLDKVFDKTETIFSTYLAVTLLYFIGFISFMWFACLWSYAVNHLTQTSENLEPI